MSGRRRGRQRKRSYQQGTTVAYSHAASLAMDAAEPVHITPAPDTTQPVN